MWRFAFRPDFVSFLPIFLTCGAARWPQWAQIHAVPGTQGLMCWELLWAGAAPEGRRCPAALLRSAAQDLIYFFVFHEVGDPSGPSSVQSLRAEWRETAGGRHGPALPPIPPSSPSHPATHRLSRGGFWIWGFIFTIILLNSCKLRLPVTTTSITPNS